MAIGSAVNMPTVGRTEMLKAEMPRTVTQQQIERQGDDFMSEPGSRSQKSEAGKSQILTEANQVKAENNIR